MTKVSSFLLSLVLATFFINPIFAQEADLDKYPDNLGLTTAGTEFWLALHPGEDSGTDQDKIILHLFSEFSATVKLEDVRGDFEQEVQLTAGITNEVEVDRNLLMPYDRSAGLQPEIDKIWGASGFHITADYPIEVIVTVDFLNQKAVFKALPLSSLGTNYYVNSVPDDGDNIINWNTSYVTIVGTEDATSVEITVGGTAGTETANGFQVGQTKGYIIYKGDVLLIGTLGSGSDLTGTKIESNKPVAVMSGAFNNEVPAGTCCSNYLINQEIPIESYGSTYIVTPFTERDSSSIINVIPSQPNTIFFINGEVYDTLEVAGGLKDEGWFRYFPKELGTPYVITADKPFSVAQINRAELGNEKGPELRILNPFEIAMNEITFSIPDDGDRDNFNDHIVDLIFNATSSNRVPGDLEIAELEDGEWEWRNVNSFSNNAGTKIPHDLNGMNYHYKTLELNSQTYKLRANDPIYLMLHGYSKFHSYASKAVGSYPYRNSDDELAPEIEWSFNTEESRFDVIVEDSSTGLAYLFILPEQSFNVDVTSPYVSPGVTKDLEFTIPVNDPEEDAVAFLYLTDKAGNNFVEKIFFYPEKLRVSVSEVDLGLNRLDSLASAEFTIYNDSEFSELNIESIDLSQGLEFSISHLEGTDLEFPLDPIATGDSLILNIDFSSSEFGMFYDTLSITTSVSSEVYLTMMAETSEPVINVEDLDFGEVSIINQVTKEIRVSNEGKFDLEIYALSDPQSTDFIISNAPDFSYEDPYVLQENQFFRFRVTFAPSEIQNYREEIVISNNAYLEDSIAVVTAAGITSVEDSRYFDEEIIVFPNPAVSDANLKLVMKQPVIASVKIIDVNAKVISEPVISKNLSAGVNLINLKTDNLASGTYYLEIRVNEELELVKFNIKK